MLSSLNEISPNLNDKVQYIFYLPEPVEFEDNAKVFLRCISSNSLPDIEIKKVGNRWQTEFPIELKLANYEFKLIVNNEENNDISVIKGYQVGFSEWEDTFKRKFSYGCFDFDIISKVEGNLLLSTRPNPNSSDEKNDDKDHNNLQAAEVVNFAKQKITTLKEKIVKKEIHSDFLKDYTDTDNIGEISEYFTNKLTKATSWEKFKRNHKESVIFENLSHPEKYAFCQKLLDNLKEGIESQASAKEYGDPGKDWVTIKLSKEDGHETKKYQVPAWIAKIWNIIQNANADQITAEKAIIDVYTIALEQTALDKTKDKTEKNNISRVLISSDGYIQWVEDKAKQEAEKIKNKTLIPEKAETPRAIAHSVFIKKQFEELRGQENPYKNNLAQFHETELNRFLNNKDHKSKTLNQAKIELQNLNDVNQIKVHYKNFLKNTSFFHYRRHENKKEIQNLIDLEISADAKSTLEGLKQIITALCFENIFVTHNAIRDDAIIVRRNKSHKGGEQDASESVKRAYVAHHAKEIYELIERAEYYDITYQEAIKKIHDQLVDAIGKDGLKPKSTNRDITTHVFYQETMAFIVDKNPSLFGKNNNQQDNTALQGEQGNGVWFKP